jgi:hypothetical protein
MYFTWRGERENGIAVKVFYSDHFVLPLPRGTASPHGQVLDAARAGGRVGICGPGELRVAEPVSDEEICAPHHRTT